MTRKPKLYLFSWDDVPGNNKEIIKFLKDRLKKKWVEKAEIKKSDDKETITVTKEDNSLTFRLNKPEKKVTLEIAGGEIYEYILKDEGGKLKVYLNENEVVIKKKKKKDKIDISQFVFEWDNVPGKDEEGLRNYLKTNFFVDWSDKAKIEKYKKDSSIIHNGIPIVSHECIIASHAKHCIKFQLDEVGYLFNLKEAYRKYIKEGIISEELRDGFYQNKLFLPATAEVKKINDAEWRVVWNRADGLVDIYTIKDLEGGDGGIRVYCEGRVFVENEDGVREILIIRKKAGRKLVYDNVITLENIVASISINLEGIRSKYINDNRLDIKNIIEREYMNIFMKAVEKGNVENIINWNIINDKKECEYIMTFRKEIKEISKRGIEKNVGEITEIFRKTLRKAIEKGDIEKVIGANVLTFLYNKLRFPGIVYRLKDLQLAMLLFDSGSVICTGAGREEFVAKARDRLVEKLKEFDINLKSEPKIEVQNIVASTMFYPKINLDILADYDENTEYEPEQFPGLIYKIAEPKTVMLVFRSGRIVITGAKSVDAAIIASKKTKKAIMDAKALICE